jgi:molecular chaperone DnaK (HSP70)
MNLNRLIGMKPDSEYSKREIQYLVGDPVLKISEEDYFYQVPLKEENLFLSSESLLAAFLNKIKNDLIAGLHKKQYVSFTLAVQDYMTLGQREAMSRALKICEIDNFSLINESSAITLYYGYNRYKDLFLEKGSTAINPNTSKYVMFLDMGHSKTTFFISEFRPQFFRVASCESNPFLGGREMDKLIFNHLCGAFYNKYKIDISSNKKSAFRLMEQITKARKVLTGNQETVISIDCLYEDYDFSYLLKRSEFELLIKPLLDNFASSLERFYKSTLNVIDKTVTAIEMAGECMRIPIIAQIVKEVTGKELQKSIIIDEAVSKGCSLYTALINEVLPLQSFNGIYHYNNYSIVYNMEGDSNSAFLIHKAEPLPISKYISVSIPKYDQIIRFAFYYLKHEVEFISSNLIAISELSINIPELLKVNKLSSIQDNKFLMEILIDNSGKPTLQALKLSNEKILNLDINVLCLNPNIKYECLISRPLIKNRVEEFNIVDELKKLEYAHLQQDELIKNIHQKKNLIESNVYKLKNKYFEKESEYENLHSKYFEGQPQRTLLSRLNSVEGEIMSENIEPSILENVGRKLSEIEKIFNRNFSNPIKSNEPDCFKKIKEKLDLYTQLTDQEYVKILEGKKSNLDERTISLISEILSKYRIIFENCDYNDLDAHASNLDKEMKKYFKL